MSRPTAPRPEDPDARDIDFCVRVLYRASRDAWICGDNAEAERLASLALKTRLSGEQRT